MKVLFLDVDGVLNRDGTKEKTSNGFIGVDRVLSDKLLNWMEGKDITIVLSSSWRLGEETFGDIFTGHLKEAGINWIDVTPNLGGKDRGLEIKEWLDRNQDILFVTHFAILDDMSPRYMKPLAKNAVQTSYTKGLEDKHLEMLNKLLEV